jgi:hypothetical protein
MAHRFLSAPKSLLTFSGRLEGAADKNDGQKKDQWTFFFL